MPQRSSPTHHAAPSLWMIWEHGSPTRLTTPRRGTPHAAPSPRNLILVSPEVGMGVIPEHRSGRLFRDEIGALNGTLAALCERVTLVVAGIPLTLKP